MPGLAHFAGCVPASTSLRMTGKGNLMRILSGIQSTGNLHIGNYFGTMQQAVALQAEDEACSFVAAYHALTSRKNPAVLRENARPAAPDSAAPAPVPSGWS